VVAEAGVGVMQADSTFQTVFGGGGSQHSKSTYALHLH